MAIVSSPSLQFQAGFTGTFSKCLNTAVVYETAAVIDHFGNAFFKALLGDALANLLGSVAVAAVVLKVLFQGGGGSQRNTSFIVDHLAVDVLGRAENIQTRTLGSAADLAADAAVTAKTSFVLISLIDHNVSPLLLFALAGFAFLTDDKLADIADALAFVRLRRALAADFGRKLADFLLVAAQDAEMQSILDFDLDGLGFCNLNRVREAQGQDQLAALLCAAVANALDLQVLAEALTPTTMLWMLVRVRPWRLRASFSSLGRVTKISLPSTLTVIRGWNLECRVPLGPFTVMA
jgi:hypothetical protein